MRLSTLFLLGVLLYGALSGLQCHYGLFQNASSMNASTKLDAHPYPLKSSGVKTTTTTTADSISIEEYVDRAIASSTQLAILYWNSSGALDLPPLVEQCQFHNFTEAGLWPFYLQNLKISKKKKLLALYPTSDATCPKCYNWSVPSPIPIVAHTLPIEIADHLDRYPWVRFLPTPYELRGDGQRWVERTLKHAASIPFAQRTSQLVYRGTANSQKSPENQRTQVLQMGQDPQNQPWLNTTGGAAKGGGLTQRDQVRFKYLLDIGGISGTTWTSLRWKLCSSSLVFKVDSGFADWWHDKLVPFQHYVPVQRDLSDLQSQFLWAESHPEQAQQIAQNGKQVCLETTAKDYLRRYTLQQLESMPTPTNEQMGEYHNLLEDSQRRFQQGRPSLLFNKHDRFKSEQHRFSCPPELSPENI